MIRNNLKSYRHKYEMNQTEFARFLGVALPQYNRYENNQTQPTLIVALRISERLGVAVNEIFTIVSEIQKAGLGYVLIQMLPLLMDLLVEIAKSF